MFQIAALSLVRDVVFLQTSFPVEKCSKPATPHTRWAEGHKRAPPQLANLSMTASTRCHPMNVLLSAPSQKGAQAIQYCRPPASFGGDLVPMKLQRFHYRTVCESVLGNPVADKKKHKSQQDKPA